MLDQSVLKVVSKPARMRVEIGLMILVIAEVVRLSSSEAQSLPSSTLRERRFYLVKNPSGSNTDNPLQTFIRVRTVISCAGFCSQLSSCNGFSYNSIEQLCNVYDVNSSQYSVDNNWSFYQSISGPFSQNTSENGLKASSTSTNQPQLSKNSLTSISMRQPLGYSAATSTQDSDTISVTFTTSHAFDSKEILTDVSSSLTPKPTSTSISESQKTSAGKTLSAATLTRTPSAESSKISGTSIVISGPVAPKQTTTAIHSSSAEVVQTTFSASSSNALSNSTLKNTSAVTPSSSLSTLTETISTSEVSYGTLPMNNFTVKQGPHLTEGLQVLQNSTISLSSLSSKQISTAIPVQKTSSASTFETLFKSTLEDISAVTTNLSLSILRETSTSKSETQPIVKQWSSSVESPQLQATSTDISSSSIPKQTPTATFESQKTTSTTTLKDMFSDSSLDDISAAATSLSFSTLLDPSTSMPSPLIPPMGSGGGSDGGVTYLPPQTPPHFSESTEMVPTVLSSLQGLTFSTLQETSTSKSSSETQPMQGIGGGSSGGGSYPLPQGPTQSPSFSTLDETSTIKPSLANQPVGVGGGSSSGNSYPLPQGPTQPASYSTLDETSTSKPDPVTQPVGDGGGNSGGGIYPPPQGPPQSPYFSTFDETSTSKPGLVTQPVGGSGAPRPPGLPPPPPPVVAQSTRILQNPTVLSGSLTPEETSTEILKSQSFSTVKQTTSDSRTQAAPAVYNPKPTYVDQAQPSTTTIPIVASTSAVTSEVKIPPVNCSFPFTLDGVLCYNCTAADDADSADVGCFVENRVWFGCLPPLDYQAEYTIVEAFIPATNETIIIVMSIHSWIIISQRIDGSLSFNRNWTDYKNGFGSFLGASSNFWVGNDRLNYATNHYTCMLRAEFQFSQTGGWYSAEYTSFVVDSEAEGYMLHLAGYSGDAGDSLIRSDNYGANGMKFSTPDVDNDLDKANCAALYLTGWWMNQCYEANLNGIYNTGMEWDSIVDDLKLLTDGTLLTARMMIKLLDYGG